MAEGAPLLRAYRRNLIEGSNPSLSAIIKKPDGSRVFLSVNKVALTPIFAGLAPMIFHRLAPMVFPRLTPKRRTATELFRP